MIQSELVDIDLVSGNELQITIYFTFLPLGLKIIGSPVELHSLRRIVVFPAFARPITRIRNWVNFARILSSVVVGLRSSEVDIAVEDALVDVKTTQLYTARSKYSHTGGQVPTYHDVFIFSHDTYSEY